MYKTIGYSLHKTMLKKEKESKEMVGNENDDDGGRGKKMELKGLL